jgi:hypothetical protein
LDGFRYLPDLQSDIHRNALLDIEIYRFGDCLLEPGMLDCDRVMANPKGTGNVLAGVISRSREIAAAFHVRDRYSGMANEGAGRILHRANDAACVLLRWRDRRKSQDKNNQSEN